MIRLKFKGIRGEVDSVIVGPAPGFRVAGNFLRQYPEGTIEWEYKRHQWHVRGGHFSRYDCIDPCCIYFMDAEGGSSQTFGPLDGICVADGTMYSGTKLFAKFTEESLLW